MNLTDSKEESGDFPFAIERFCSRKVQLVVCHHNDGIVIVVVRFGDSVQGKKGSVKVVKEVKEVSIYCSTRIKTDLHSVISTL